MLKKAILFVFVDFQYHFSLKLLVYIAEKYLKNCGFKVAGYRYFKEIRSLKEIEFDKYDCFCLPNWKAELLKDLDNDLFINCGSFQEMEKKQVKNYLEIFKDHPYVFNLGHGILPETETDMVYELVETVRNYK